MENYLLSLPVPNMLGLVFFACLVAGLVAVTVTDAMVKAVVQHRIAAVDEFIDLEDVTATNDFNPAHVSRLFLRGDDEFRRIDMKSFTCTTCPEQESCPLAFNLQCTDGYCITK